VGKEEKKGTSNANFECLPFEESSRKIRIFNLLATSSNSARKKTLHHPEYPERIPINYGKSTFPSQTAFFIFFHQQKLGKTQNLPKRSIGSLKVPRADWWKKVPPYFAGKDLSPTTTNMEIQNGRMRMQGINGGVLACVDENRFYYFSKWKKRRVKRKSKTKPTKDHGKSAIFEREIVIPGLNPALTTGRKGI